MVGRASDMSIRLAEGLDGADPWHWPGEGPRGRRCQESEAGKEGSYERRVAALAGSLRCLVPGVGPGAREPALLRAGAL